MHHCTVFVTHSDASYSSEENKIILNLTWSVYQLYNFDGLQNMRFGLSSLYVLTTKNMFCNPYKLENKIFKM